MTLSGFNGGFFLGGGGGGFSAHQAWGMQLYFHVSLVCNFMDLVNG